VKIYGPAPTETFVSRVFGSFTALRSASTTFTPPSTIKDLVSKPLPSSQVLQAFQPGEVQAIGPAGTLVPGVFQPQAEPAEASKRPGLNEYTVSVERLTNDASPDFSWEPISGISLTKPPSGPVVATPINPRLVADTAKRRTASRTKVTAAAATARPKITDNGPEIVAVPGVLAIAPLWEGDVTLPVATDNRPRRLVVREQELYFKATPAPLEFVPIARRLVYVDIVNLPSAPA
jgi:hypothetical protein